MRVPLADEASVVTHVPETPHANARRRHPDRRGPDRDGRRSLSRFLQLAGHDVRVASTGPEGLKLALETHPDFVLCDHRTPRPRRLSSRRRAPARTPRPPRPISIAITGYGSDKDRQLSHPRF